MTSETPTKVIKQRRPRSPRVVLRTTPEIIDRALPKDSGHCVWADALKEACPTAKRISVDLQTIRFTDLERGLRFTYLTPRAVQVDLVNFDQGIMPQPKTIGLRGAQVTKANPRGVTRRGANNSVPNRGTLSGKRGEDGGNVPDKIGGRTPPLGAYRNVGGQRREFGLRGLGRVSADES